MSSISITLPDGSSQSVNAGTRPIDIARAISPRLADDAVVARVNGQFFDLTRPLEADRHASDPHLQESRGARSLPPLDAHLLAAAVLELYPETKTRSRAAIDTGFYYDFQRAEPFTPDDLRQNRGEDVGDPGARPAL